MGGEGVAGCAGLATIITYQRRMQCARRAAGAGTEIGGTAAAAQSHIARFQSQRRAGPLSECRRPLAIRRRIAASRPARMMRSNEFASLPVLAQLGPWAMSALVPLSGAERTSAAPEL